MTIELYKAYKLLEKTMMNSVECNESDEYFTPGHYLVTSPKNVQGLLRANLEKPTEADFHHDDRCTSNNRIEKSRSPVHPQNTKNSKIKSRKLTKRLKGNDNATAGTTSLLTRAHLLPGRNKDSPEPMSFTVSNSAKLKQRRERLRH